MNPTISRSISELYRLTKDGSTLTNSFGELCIERRSIGPIFFPTGKVVACDPHVILDKDLPFSTDIPVGHHHVIICVAHIKPPTNNSSVEPEDMTDIELLAIDLAEMIKDKQGIENDPRNVDRQLLAASILQISKNHPVSWEVASNADHAGENQEDKKTFRYMVDSGTGSFMDMKAKKNLQKKYEEDENYHNVLNDQMGENYSGEYSWSIPIIDNNQGLNFAMFTTGEGDGEYVSYWGYDKKGMLVCLLTEFGILIER